MTGSSRSRGPRHGLGVLLGIVGTAVTFWLFAGGFASAEQPTDPDTTRAAAFTALQSLGGGAVLGAVLFAGRVVSPSAPLSSGLTWAVGSVASLADPALVGGLGPPGAQSLMTHQLGLGLTALMLAGTAVVAPSRSASHQHRRPARADRPVAAGPPRAQGPGPRHRAAAPRRSPSRASPLPPHHFR